MKIKEGLILKEVAGECVVVPIDAALNLDGMITLNGTAKTLWLALEKGAETEDLVRAITDEYDASEELALVAVESFIKKLRELDFLA